MTRAPTCLPFHVKITSSFQSMLFKSGSQPKEALRLRRLGILKWLLAAALHPSTAAPKHLRCFGFFSVMISRVVRKGGKKARMEDGRERG
jgi:hypothetical protein